jgi:hypothetical protein
LDTWFSKFDSLFEGENELKAKSSTQNMASGQFLKMCEVKPEHKK